MSENFDLVADMEASPAFLALLADDDFCCDLWGAFANITWMKKYDSSVEDTVIVHDLLSEAYRERTWGASFRAMGGVIAELRNKYHQKQETYMHWYCSDRHGYGVVTDEIRTALLELGWVPVEDEYYREANQPT